MKNSSSTGSRSILRKLAVYGFAGVVIIYLVAVASGYSWLRFVRKNEQVALLDVAFFKINAVRRGLAVQHFAKAQAEWDAKNFQSAYLFFSSGVRQDPDNISGRLNAMRFLRSVGAGNQAATLLEEGLARAPQDRRLIEPTFELLLATGRDHRVLEILKERYSAGSAGENAALLQRYEMEATLADGAPAARQFLDKHPALLDDPLASRIVARVLWETQERLKGMTVLQRYLATQRGVYADYALLAGWQEAAGQTSDAVATARRATEKFPSEVSPRVLLIEMLAAETPVGTAAPRAIAEFLRDYGSRPESIQELAVLAGRKGWIDLSRTLYELSANRQNNFSVIALSYCDALARGGRFKEVRQMLSELEPQIPEENRAVWVQLRQRQVIAAAALGDSINVREYARRLASVLSRDPDGLEVCRRLFRKMGIADAVAELSSRSLAGAALAKK